MRAILINPHLRTITEMDAPGPANALHDADPQFSGTIERIQLGRSTDLWIDEEGNLSDGRPVWKLNGNPFAGCAVLFCNDNRGHTLPLAHFVTLDVMHAVTNWTDLVTTGDFEEGRVGFTDHPILGPKTPTYLGGAPIYRERDTSEGQGATETRNESPTPRESTYPHD